LKRALLNLIVNAATHGGGATIELAREGNEAVMRIRDKGPGIPEELIAHVFEPFFRVDAARRKSMPGAGLGLAIAKEIIERFGGTIAIANTDRPKGLIQTVRLPLSGSPERL
jgi:signal transduction histidine kinase